jgi:type III restriction enzyme
LVAAIVNKTQVSAGLTGNFAELYPLVHTYLEQRCFGEPIDLDADTIRTFLANPSHQEKVATLLGRRLGELTVEEQPIELEAAPILLSKTSPFHWRRQHAVCDKTIFNYIATFNPFETLFGEFLASRKDVLRFAALAEHFTGFWVDYMKPSGAIGRYFPDWVAIQRTSEGEVNWIIETKGRVWDGTEQKDAAIRYWCEQVTELAGESWCYMRVDQPIFKPDTLHSFADLVELIDERNAAIDEQVLFTPETTAAG